MKCKRCGSVKYSETGICPVCGFADDKKARKPPKENTSYRYIPDPKFARDVVAPKEKQEEEDTSFHFTPESRLARDVVSGNRSTDSHSTQETVDNTTEKSAYTASAQTDNPAPVQAPQQKDEQNWLKETVKKLVCAAIVVVAVMFAADTLYTFVNELVNPSKSNSTKTESLFVAETEPVYTYSEPMETVQTVPVQPALQAEYTFYSIWEMKETLAPTCIAEDLDVTISYKGDRNDIYKYAHCFLFGGREGSITELEPGIFRITAKPYSGSKILKAYQTGDHRDLTADEVETLYKAEAVVNAARKEANSDMELEMWLHDWMCENISYYDVDFSIEFTDRRQLNAVGALLDGKANCQGYTDCFYLLGNMAGFIVDRQVMPEHIFNTIKLGGNWYIVDVTHDDCDTENFGRKQYLYQYFNVGLDHTDGRTWAYEETRNTISPRSDSYFYYYMIDNADYSTCYDLLDDLAWSAIQEYKSGKKLVHMMLRGAELTFEELFAAMNRVAEREGVRYYANVTYSNGVGCTFYVINFE